ncbi:MAG: PEGA domain-containing protein [Pseudobdellovibrionaceae bacterium]
MRYLILSILLFPVIAFTQEGVDKRSRAILVMYIAPTKVNLERADILSKVLTDTIRSELSKSSNYKLANIDGDDAVELAKKYNETCTSVEECVRKEAEALDADQALISEVSGVGDKCFATLRIEDIYKKQTVRTKTSKTSCAVDGLQERLIDLVYQILRDDVQKGSGERLARITSDIPARVFINNVDYGITPVEKKIPTGQVKLTLEIASGKTDRFYPISESIFVGASQEMLVINKTFAERNAYIKFEVSPPSATVTIDGRVIDFRSSAREPVEVGREHEIKIAAPQHVPFVKTVKPMEPDEEYELKVKLESFPCSVRISSNPEGAEILEGDRVIGSTPYSGQLPEGEHSLTVRREFYDSEVVSFLCDPEQAIQRTVILKRSVYSQAELDRIRSAESWRTISYYGFGITAALSTGAYLKFDEFNKFDKQYKEETHPAEIESLRKQRTAAKSQFVALGSAAAGTFLLSYLFYKIGDFPADLKSRSPQSLYILPDENSAKIGWLLSW